MARPIKATVDYFSHDADASDGKTVTILENHFGVEGYAAWFKLLERLSRTRNHFISLRNGEETEYLSAKLRITPNRLLEILNKMAELHAIDTELYAHKVIWCQNFIDRLKEVYDNRRQPLPPKPTIDSSGNPVISPILQPITGLTAEEIQQSKLKETKLNNNGEEPALAPTEKETNNEMALSVKQLRKYPETNIPLVKGIFAGLKKRRGYNSTKPSAEAVAVNEMLKLYSTDQILNVWDMMKKEKFWQDKELFMMTVKNQIGAKLKDIKPQQGAKYTVVN